MPCEIYISGHVQQIQRLYRPIINDLTSYPTLKKQLKGFLEIAYDSYKSGQNTFALEFSNYHPKWLGKYEEIINYENHSWEDFELVIARAYGFKNWDEVILHGNQSFDAQFEKAIDFVLSGKLEALKKLLSNNPGILQTKSIYGHQASLIHYVGSNGIEIWRQQVPNNLPSILKFLLDSGADPNSINKIYGTGSQLIDLIESSDHPFTAGLSQELIHILKQ